MRKALKCAGFVVLWLLAVTFFVSVGPLAAWWTNHLEKWLGL